MTEVTKRDVIYVFGGDECVLCSNVNAFRNFLITAL